MPTSLRRGLLWRMSLLMLAFSAIAAVVVYDLTLRFSDEAYDEWLLDSAHSLSQLVQYKNGHVVVDLPTTTLQAMIWDAHDKVLFRIDDQAAGLIAGQSELHAPLLWSAASVNYIDTQASGQPMRAVQIIRHDLRPGSLVAITMAETLHKRHRLASRVLGTVMALSLLLGLAMLVLARDGITRGLRPLLELTHAIHERPRGDLTRLPDAAVAKELRTFTNAINALLEQLAQAVELQRRFVADAAHQLRTPLAALKVELEHALRESDPALHKQALSQLKAALDRLSRLTNQLLTLARAEPGALASSSFKPLDLHDLVYQTAQRLLPRSMSQGADLGFEGHAHPWIVGDPLLLEEMVNNLLDNALKYAGAQACITVSVHADQTHAHIMVEDNGPGVAAAELPHLIERFHRPPGSTAGGSGLGLSIVQEIALRHQGALLIKPAMPHGLRVTITLPRFAKDDT